MITWTERPTWNQLMVLLRSVRWELTIKLPQLQFANRTSLWAEPEITWAPSICSLGAALRLRPLSRDLHRHSGHAARRRVLMKCLTADGSSSAATQPKKA